MFSHPIRKENNLSLLAVNFILISYTKREEPNQSERKSVNIDERKRFYHLVILELLNNWVLFNQNNHKLNLIELYLLFLFKYIHVLFIFNIKVDKNCLKNFLLNLSCKIC